MGVKPGAERNNYNSDTNNGAREAIVRTRAVECEVADARCGQCGSYDEQFAATEESSVN